MPLCPRCRQRRIPPAGTCTPSASTTPAVAIHLVSHQRRNSCRRLVRSRHISSTTASSHADLNFNWQVDHISFDCHSSVGGSCVDAGPNLYVWGNACDSHATSVAGVVGAIRQNPAKAWKVWPRRATGVGQSDQCVHAITHSGLIYTSGVLAAINWIGSSVPNNGVDQNGRRRLSGVANISILWAYQTYGPASLQHPGGSTGRAQVGHSILPLPGVFFTFAAGNSNEPACNIFPAAIGYDTAGAMAVGALQQNGNPCARRATTPWPRPGNAWKSGRRGRMHSTGHGQQGWKKRTTLGSRCPLIQSFSRPALLLSELPGSSLAPHAAGAALLLARSINWDCSYPPADIESLIQSQRQPMNYQWNPLNWNIGNTRVNCCGLTISNPCSLTCLIRGGQLQATVFCRIGALHGYPANISGTSHVQTHL